MTEIIQIKEIKLFNFPKQWIITKCSSTADCIHVHVDVHVAGIGKEETYSITFILAFSLILRFLRRSNKMVEIFITTRLSKYSYKWSCV